MAYSAQTDILEQLPEIDLIGLTDDEAAGVVDESVVARAIADADATIDSYLQTRYSVPLSPVPDKVRLISVDLAIYNVFSRRSLDPPEVRKDRKKDAMAWLKMVAEGKISLGSDEISPANAANDVQITDDNRIFSRTKMDGF